MRGAETEIFRELVAQGFPQWSVVIRRIPSLLAPGLSHFVKGSVQNTHMPGKTPFSFSAPRKIGQKGRISEGGTAGSVLRAG